MDLRREIARGDQVRLVYFQDARGELIIAAARYQSTRKGTWFDAYRFQASGDASASYWDAEGVEVPARLREGPLRSYDQITALLKDLNAAGIRFRDLETVQSSLEDIFVGLVSNKS